MQRCATGGPVEVECYEQMLEHLSTLAEGLAAATQLQGVYRLLGDFVRRCTPCNGMFIALLDASSLERHCVYAWSEGKEEDPRHLPPLPLTDSPHSRAVRTGQIVVTADFQATNAPGALSMDIGMDRDPRKPQSSLAVPMAIMGRVIGALEIQSVERAAYGVHHVTALRMAAPLAAMAIENVRLLGDERRLRHAAEDSERRKAAILDSALDAIITIDHHGRVVEFNRAAERMFGHSRAAATGRLLEELIVPPAMRERHRQGLAARVRTGKASLGSCVEMPAMRSDGTEFPAEFSITQVVDSAPPMFTGFVRDLSDRRRAERERASLEAQLRQSQKMEAIGTLAAGIAHDFNNILANVLGNAELMRHAADGDTGLGVPLAEITRAGHRGRDLVQQILSFGQRQPTTRASLSPADVARESVPLLRAAVPGPVELLCECAPDVPAVEGDATQIGQVLASLVTNAAHAIGNRPGRIVVRVEKVVLDEAMARAIHGARPGTYARLFVIDNGHGMDAATVERIFEPFFTTKPAGQGTGLGLPVVHGIVRDHDGAITVESAPGKGTRIGIYLPATEKALPPPDTAAEPRVAGRGQRILYLDDDEALVDLYTRLLRRTGYRVSGHLDAEEALAELRACPGAFDLVLTDHNMPHMSGMQVARAVRDLDPSIPVVMISGYINAEMKAEAASAGIRAVVSKPHALEELPRVLRGLLGAPGSGA